MTRSWLLLDSETPTFKAWLWENYQTTPFLVLDLCKKTSRSPRRDFEKVMDWYRRRYRQEMIDRQALKEAYEKDPVFEENNNKQMEEM